MIRLSQIISLAIILYSCNSGTLTNEKEQLTEEIIETRENNTNYANSLNGEVFTQIKADRLSNSSYQGFRTDESYQYENYKFLFGNFNLTPGHTSKSKFDTDIDFGLRLLVLDEDDNLLFRSDGQGDSYNLSPTFFKLNKQFPILILSEIGTEYSWGNVVYYMDNKEVKEIGTIELARHDKEADNYTDISNFTKIIKDGKNIIFSFETDSLIVEPGGVNQQTVTAKGLHYIYNGKDFKLVKE